MGADYKDFEKLKNSLEKEDWSYFNKYLVNQLTQRLLRKVIKRTPVGIYPRGSGKVGGTLRRNWNFTRAIKRGNEYSATVLNPTEYSSYVEYGHRTRLGKNGTRRWIEGRFMLTKSTDEIKNSSQKIIEKEIQKKLSEVFK